MYKLAIKFLIMTLVLTGTCLIFSSHGKVAAATTSCPAGDSAPADWGNDSDGEGAGVMSSLVMRARDTSGNPINSKFTLQSQAPGWSDNAQIYRWPIGSGGSVSNTDTWAQHGDFQFGTHLSGDGGISCNGWVVLGPGIDGNVGNGWVLNCKNPSGNNNTFWLSHVDNPTSGGQQQQGQWWLLDSSSNVLDYDVNSGTSPHIKFPVTNGANMRFTLVWHPTPNSFTLNAASTINGQSGTIYKQPNENVNFGHLVHNNGPNDANYSWVIKQQTNGGGWSEYGNLDSNGNITVANGNNGPQAPNGAKSVGYNVPNGASNGYTYCQRIDYTYTDSGGTTVNGSSTPACLIVGTTPPSHTLGCSATSYNVSHQGGHRQYIQLTGTDSDGSYYVSPNGSGRDTIDLNYTALAQTVHVDIHRYTWNGSAWIEDAGSPAPHSYGCYHATCTVTGVQGTGPGNIVLAGQPFKVFVTVTNDNGDASAETIPTNAGGHDFSITEAPDEYQGGYVHNSTGFTASPPSQPGGGQPVGPKEIDFGGNGNSSSIRQLTLNFFPDLADYGSLGSGCSTTFNIYQKFNASASSSTNLAPTTEHPSSVSYNASANFSWDNPPGGLANHAVNDAVSASFYKKAASGAISYPCSPSSYSGGTFTIQSNPTVFSGGCGVPVGSYQAGDEFCTAVALTYSSGYVGPDNNVAYGTPAGAISPNCPRVVNEPYFKVYNSDISAGGSFNNCTTAGGTLAGYADISDPANATRGSTTQLSALALLKITGVASAKTSASINGSPTKLSFANTGVQVDGSGNESPILGGQYNGCRTLTNETPPGASAAGATFNVSGANGAWTRTGNTTVNGGSLAANQNTSLFVTGNVYIASDIAYGDGWQAGTAPSLVIHATGNIYIAAGVHKMAGLYIAQDSGGSGGKIYTCASPSNHFSPMPATSLYSGCHDQLIVTGSFVAKQVNLMRTFGSLRDEEPNPAVGAVAPVAPTAGSPQINLIWGSAGTSGVPAGYGCVHIDETSDSHTWDDNYLCEAPGYNVALAWTHYANNPSPSGNPADGWDSVADLQAKGYYYCTQWYAAGDPDTWNDNYLCANKNIGLTFSGSNLTSSTENCTNISESADPDANWSRGGYWLCAQYSAGTPGSPGSPGSPPSPKGPPYTSCSNPGTQADSISCASEVFEYSPTLYLSNPAVNPPGGGSLQFQSIESLPPVL